MHGSALDDYEGVIIEESLRNKAVLGKVEISQTRVSRVTKRHKTPWLKHWTLHTVRIPEANANRIASELSRSLDETHGESWYADFRNDRFHYIVFRDKVFKISTGDARGYGEVRRYGRGLGIPDYQLDFTPP